MGRLQDRLLSQRDATIAARRSSEDMIAVMSRFIDEQGTAVKGEAALAELATVRQGLDALVRLKESVLATTGDADSANTAAEGLIALKNKVLAQSADTSVAQSAAENLITLKDDLASNTNNVDAARIRANKLMLLQDDLSNDQGDLTVAFTNLDSLIDIKGKLAAQTDSVGDAVQNLELLSDFQDEFAQRIASLGGMRQSLMEFVMLETTIGRVAQTLQPLVQLGNVRRLGDKELREAARVILEQRSTRVTHKTDADTHVAAPGSAASEVPVPTKDELSSPVPVPID
jgi:hypothetical protein